MRVIRKSERQNRESMPIPAGDCLLSSADDGDRLPSVLRRSNDCLLRHQECDHSKVGGSSYARTAYAERNRSDASILITNWGSIPPGHPIADVNSDGVVDAADVSVVFTNWTGDSVTVVPEPSGDFLLAIVLAGALSHHRLARRLSPPQWTPLVFENGHKVTALKNSCIDKSPAFSAPANNQSMN